MKCPHCGTKAKGKPYSEQNYDTLKSYPLNEERIRIIFCRKCKETYKTSEKVLTKKTEAELENKK